MAHSSDVLETSTFLDALVVALQRAGRYNRNDQAAPAAVLWPDKERQWEPLLPLLRERLPLLTLGPYAPDQFTGPAYWLRAVLEGAIPETRLPAEATPIIYLPGVSRQEIRGIDSTPRLLQPLAELQYRGIIWTHKNGRDWTVPSFLQSPDGGLGIEVAGDSLTREALNRALLRLAREPLAELRREAPLRAAFFNALLHPDEVRNLLLWLNDPTGFAAGWTPGEAAAFAELAKSKYKFDPHGDGPISAAGLLGKRQGPWEKVWQRFAEAPQSYPNLPALLRAAKPQGTLLPSLGDAESWPQDNEAAEDRLRNALLALENVMPAEARLKIEHLEEEHAPRRATVWVSFHWTPLANALAHLRTLATTTTHNLGGPTTSDLIAAYTDWGWEADAAFLDALAAVEHPQDVAAVRTAGSALYRPWLEAGAVHMQHLVGVASSTTYPRAPLPLPEPGTCVLFTDSLRFDAGCRLASALVARGLVCDVRPQLAALPTITPTAKPACSPVAALFTGGTRPVLTPVVAASGAQSTIEVLRKVLTENGYEVLRTEDLGDPSGRAWTEAGAIDGYGHEHGWKIAHHQPGELRSLERLIASLLDHGWQTVVVVTDHGWIMLPGGLPKVELPEHLTTLRKGRCARLKEGTSVDTQTVPWFWDASVAIAIAPGISCYEAGKEYEHGGISPQECIVPLLTVRASAATLPSVTVEQVTWRRLRCTIKLSTVVSDLRVDVRSRAADASTSLVPEAKAPGADGTVSLIVPDEDQEGAAAFVVVTDLDGRLLAQLLTTIGG